MLSEIRQASPRELVFSLIVAAGALCPGMLVIWTYRPELIEKSGAVVFVLLSIALTLPMIALNSLGIMLVLATSKKDEFDIIAPFSMALGSLISLLVFGIPLVISFMATLSLKSFSWMVLTLELLFGVFIIVSFVVFVNRGTEKQVSEKK